MKKQYIVYFNSRAQDEIAEAYAWYELQKNGLGDAFLKSVDNSILSVQKSPKGYTSVGKHRQVTVQKFPFVLLYEFSNDCIYIDAVFHTSRSPQKKLNS